MALYRDRHHAGRKLAEALAPHAGRSDVVVLALPRGGVPVAAEVARALGAPLDVVVVRKLGVPGNPELAMGAIAPGGVTVLEPRVISLLGIREHELAAVTHAERDELARRERLYRDGRPPLEVAGKTVILVDDGLATGSTMRGAVRAIRRRGAGRVVVAVPVGAPETCAAVRDEADEVVCAAAPSSFRAVGVWYDDFTQTTDEEVQHLLAAARGGSRWEPPSSTSSAPPRPPPSR